MGAILAERPYPTEFSQELTPLDDYRETLRGIDRGGTEAVQALDTLRERGLEVVVGVREQDVSHITAIAEQESVKAMCPDLTKRFGDSDMMRRWFKKGEGKGRGMFLLRDMVDLSLIGYGWTGPETCEAARSNPYFCRALGGTVSRKKISNAIYSCHCYGLCSSI